MFMHRRFGNFPKGGVTTYFEISEVEAGHYLVSYSVARCNMRDNFTKKFGRSIAYGRFLKRRRTGDVLDFSVHAPSYEKAREIVIKRMESICEVELEAIQEMNQIRISGLLRKYNDLIRDGVITA